MSRKWVVGIFTLLACVLVALVMLVIQGRQEQSEALRCARYKLAVARAGRQDPLSADLPSGLSKGDAQLLRRNREDFAEQFRRSPRHRQRQLRTAWNAWIEDSFIPEAMVKADCP